MMRRFVCYECVDHSNEDRMCEIYVGFPGKMRDVCFGGFENAKWAELIIPEIGELKKMAAPANCQEDGAASTTNTQNGDRQ